MKKFHTKISRARRQVLASNSKKLQVTVQKRRADGSISVSGSYWAVTLLVVGVSYNSVFAKDWRQRAQMYTGLSGWLWQKNGFTPPEAIGPMRV